jgi:hypothetical protein
MSISSNSILDADKSTNFMTNSCGKEPDNSQDEKTIGLDQNIQEEVCLKLHIFRKMN